MPHQTNGRDRLPIKACAHLSRAKWLQFFLLMISVLAVAFLVDSAATVQPAKDPKTNDLGSPSAGASFILIRKGIAGPQPIASPSSGAEQWDFGAAAASQQWPSSGLPVSSAQ